MADVEKNSKGNVLKIIIIVLLAAVLLGGGTFVGYMVASKNQPQQGSVTPVQSAFLNQKTFPLDQFLLNLKQDNATRYLKTKVSLGYADIKENKGLEEELKTKKDILKDYVGTVLRSKKPEEYHTDAGMKKVKEEIKKKINPILKEGQIIDVYFPEIIIQ